MCSKRCSGLVQPSTSNRVSGFPAGLGSNRVYVIEGQLMASLHVEYETESILLLPFFFYPPVPRARLPKGFHPFK